MSNKGQPGWENKSQNWKGGEFQTQRQVPEKITVNESLEIIDNASSRGIAVGANGQRSMVPQTQVNGQNLTLAVRNFDENQAKAQADPKINPFANANAQSSAKQRPPQRSLADLP